MFTAWCSVGINVCWVLWKWKYSSQKSSCLQGKWCAQRAFGSWETLIGLIMLSISKWLKTGKRLPPFSLPISSNRQVTVETHSAMDYEKRRGGLKLKKGWDAHKSMEAHSVGSEKREEDGWWWDKRLPALETAVMVRLMYSSKARSVCLLNGLLMALPSQWGRSPGCASHPTCPCWLGRG